MLVTFIVVAAGLVGATGLILGLFLGVASEKFKVEVDEREAKVRAALPGNNCGACGFPGCDGCAKAIAKGEAPVNQCPVGGAAVTAKIAEIMGANATGDTADKKVAFVRCQGDCDKAKQAYHYTGIADCSDLAVVPNGSEKECSYSCCGYGTCVKACKFDAIHIVNGVAVVDKEKCVACGACVKACPKHIIDIVPYKKKHNVACQNHLKGKAVKDSCSTGCIACGMCEKNCPFDAIHVTDGLAVMNDKCKDCGICAQKCPTGAITGKRPVKPAAPKPAAPADTAKTAAVQKPAADGTNAAAPKTEAATAPAKDAAAPTEVKASAPAPAAKPAEQPKDIANA